MRGRGWTTRRKATFSTACTRVFPACIRSPRKSGGSRRRTRSSARSGITRKPSPGGLPASTSAAGFRMNGSTGGTTPTTRSSITRPQCENISRVGFQSTTAARRICAGPGKNPSPHGSMSSFPCRPNARLSGAGRFRPTTRPRRTLQQPCPTRRLIASCTFVGRPAPPQRPGRSSAGFTDTGGRRPTSRARQETGISRSSACSIPRMWIFSPALSTTATGESAAPRVPSP